MASPSNINSRDITGKYVLNRSLSTNTEMDHILEYQGMGWLKRKAASHVTVSIAVKHVEDDEGVERIEIFQTLPGGLGRTELRILDWKTQTQESEILGPILAQTRRVQLGDIEDGFLKSNWLPEAVEHGLIETYGASDTVKSGKVWTLNQIWGFQEIGGHRRYVRHVLFTGPKTQRVEAIMVYDYAGLNQ